MDDEVEAAAPFFAYPVVLMECKAGNYDHRDGEPNALVTVARKASIAPMIFSLEDSRKLVTELLVVLAIYEDKFARKLLDQNFPTDLEGNFRWLEIDPDSIP